MTGSGGAWARPHRERTRTAPWNRTLILCCVSCLILVCCQAGYTHGTIHSPICRYEANHNNKSSTSPCVYALYVSSHGRNNVVPSALHAGQSHDRQQYLGIELAAQGHLSRPRVHTEWCVRTASDVVKSLITSLVVGHRPLCTQPQI